MCLQCLTNPWYYGKVLPGFFLMRARRQYFDEMQPKDWGLVVCNDPHLVFKTTPYFYEDEDQFYDHFEKWCDELKCTPDLGYMIMESFLKVPVTFRFKRLLVKYGYWHKRDRMMQLYIYMADFIRSSQPDTDPDPFPDNDKHFIYDYDFDPKEP